MPLTVIHASAGSGKTFQLALFFIRLLLKGEEIGQPQNPAAILSTTFTRAAAGEILERIIALLAGAALSEQRRASLEGHLKLPLTVVRCHRMLANIAACMDRIAVSTMDSFFAQIAKGFAGKLGLAPEWAMAVDEGAEKILRETLDSIASEADLESVTAALWTMRQGTVSSMLRTLEELAPQLPAAGTSMLDLGPFKQPAQRRWKAEELAEISALLANRDEWIPKAQTGKSDGRWKRPIDALEQSLVAGEDVVRLLDCALADRAFNDTEYFKMSVPSPLRTALMPLLRIACGELRKRHEARERALGWIAQLYSAHRSRAAFRLRSYGFGDIAEIVAAASVPSEDIYFRLGTRFEHLLFDEFQDTSRLQFDFFKPIVEEIGSRSGEVFVVGDVKQAIYGWRGGDRELMHGALNELALQLGRGDGMTLSESFRSSSAVLDAVNATFLKLHDVWLAGDDAKDGVLLDAGGKWVADFERHRAAASVRDLRGRVRLLEVVSGSRSDSDDPDGPLISKAIEIVDGHLAEDPARRVGILLRRSKLMPRLIAELRRGHPDVDVSGEGGNPLTDSRAVELILELLSWLDHPGNSAARYLVLSSPLAPVFGFPSEMRAGESPSPAEFEAAEGLRRGLCARGLAEVIRGWLRHPAFAGNCSDHDSQRCVQLLAVAREFDERGVQRLADFVAHVRTRRVERPGGSGVRVMTIHASKGLEFDAVVLMEVDARQGGGGMQVFSDAGVLRIAPSKDHAPYLGMEDVRDRRAREDFMEELSVLYVGMTRAQSLLDIILSEGSKAPVAQLLRAALPKGDDGVVAQVDGISMQEWRERKRGDVVAGESDPGFAIPGAPASVNAQSSFAGRLLHATPSGATEKSAVSVESILAPVNRGAMRRGELIHAWLKEVGWIEDGLPEVARLVEVADAIEHGFPRAEVVAMAEDLLGELQTAGAELRQALAKPSRDGGTIDLWRERRFAVLRNGEEGRELLTGSFDRVVLWRGADRKAVRAQILDFKTDRCASAEERAAIEERYAPQLRAYCEALCLLCPGLDRGVVETALVLVRGSGAGG